MTNSGFAGLPAVLGSLTALGVAFLSVSAGVSAVVFASRVGSAFVVFYAFGLVIRHLLSESLSRVEDSAAQTPELVIPGTRVSDLLEGEQSN